MAQEYKKEGGSYRGPKDESQKHIQNWDEDPKKEQGNANKNEKVSTDLLQTHDRRRKVKGKRTSGQVR
jgi:hypothetical protein